MSSCGPREGSRNSEPLKTGRSGDRIPVGARFSAAGHGAHPASHTVGTGCFSGVKRPWRGVDHPPTSSARVKERVELYHYSPSGPSWPNLGLYVYMSSHSTCQISCSLTVPYAAYRIRLGNRLSIPF